MNKSLKGRRIAILAADGFEKVEITVPEKALDGAIPHLASQEERN
jgi:hypothetical protein